MDTEVRTDYTLAPLSSFAQTVPPRAEATTSAIQQPKLEPGPSLYPESSNIVAVGSNDQVSTTSTSGPRLKLKDKGTIKYRATKRPHSERKFKCDDCNSKLFILLSIVN